MKKTFLFCTKFTLYLIELPLILLLTLAIIFNNSVESPLGLIPLIVALAIFIVFVFVYFFRLVIISGEEIRVVGVYSSKDRATINEGKTIVLTMKRHGRILCELYGVDDAPSLDWVSKEDFEDLEINLFRAKAVGTMLAVKRVLRYFEVSTDDFDELLSFDGREKVYENVSVHTEVINEFRTVKIKLLKTL